MAKQYNFRFDSTACAGCKACQIACKDKHGLEVGRLWRRVYEVTGGGWHQSGPAWTPDVFAFNLSVACNHCQRPICLEVCPAKAITRREDGIVLLDEDRCLGCSYCEWACPYGAPQFDRAAGCMTKCSFCADEIDAGRSPACVEACPLRVLEFEMLETGPNGSPAVPHKPLPHPDLTEPSLLLTPHRDAQRASKEAVEVVPRQRHEMNEWSLVVFTLLSQMAAGAVLILGALRMFPADTPLVDSITERALPVITALMLTGLGFSFFHLGNPRRAYNAVRNAGSSWLSREILVALSFTGLTAILCWLTIRSPGTRSTLNVLTWCTAVTGQVLVLVMSRVYMLRTVPAWNRATTTLSFLASSWLLGSLTIITVGRFGAEPEGLASIVRPLAVFSLVLLNFTWLIIRGWFSPTPEPGGNTLGRWLLVVSGIFALAGIIMVSFVNTGGQILPTRLAWIALVLVSGSEFLERYRFFKSYARSGV